VENSNLSYILRVQFYQTAVSVFLDLFVVFGCKMKLRKQQSLNLNRHAYNKLQSWSKKLTITTLSEQF
jgi:hypothetical protein